MTEKVAGRELFGASAFASVGKALQDCRGLAGARQAGGHFLREQAKDGRLMAAQLNQLYVVGTHHELKVVRPRVALDAQR